MMKRPKYRTRNNNRQPDIKFYRTTARFAGYCGICNTGYQPDDAIYWCPKRRRPGRCDVTSTAYLQQTRAFAPSFKPSPSETTLERMRRSRPSAAGELAHRRPIDAPSISRIFILYRLSTINRSTSHARHNHEACTRVDRDDCRPRQSRYCHALAAIAQHSDRSISYVLRAQLRDFLRSQQASA